MDQLADPTAEPAGRKVDPRCEHLTVVGVSHRTAPLPIREALAVSGDRLRERLLRLRQSVDEVMVLSTCNRYEIYLRSSAPAGDDLVLADQPQARGHLYHYSGEAALRHLYRVAASLDSLVLGEPQILGQVKDAFAAAEAAGVSGPLLSRLLSRSFSVAKRVRTETKVGENPASVASVAVGLASHIFGSLAGQPVLIIGAGEMAEQAARHLRGAQVGDLWVVNRTLSRAQELASQLGGSAHEMSALESLLGRAAVVLCSTGAPDPILRHDMLSRVMKARRGRWLLLLDIAVPRDVEARVGDLENVYLYDVDALQAAVADNLAERQREAQAGETIVRQEVLRTLQDERSMGVAPTIRRLREQSHQVAQREVERVLAKLPGLGERERQLVAQLGEAVVNKLLHGPMTALKKDAAEGGGGPSDLNQAVQILFGLTPEEKRDDE